MVTEGDLQHAVERARALDESLVDQTTPVARAAVRALRAVHRRDIEKYSRKLARKNKEK